MLLQITTTEAPTSDLSFLLHKHPDKVQTFDMSLGKAHVYYPEYNENKITVALLLDIDAVDMVRGSKNSANESFSLAQYVNDRPYVASSFMSVAIASVFSSALNGKCKNNPELVMKQLPFEVTISTLPAPKGGESLIRSLFEPLGYTIDIQRHTLNPLFPEWGESKYYTVKLSNKLTLKDLLSHLYVLIPTLDNDKHYYVNKDELNKLLEKGVGWLKHHPGKEQITKRYLSNIHWLSKQALLRLAEAEDTENNDDEIEEKTEISQRKATLHEKRIALVTEKLLESKAKKVIDLGCGEGKLLRQLLKHQQFTSIAGMDVSYSELLKAKERLYYDNLSPKQKERLILFQGSLLYLDERCKGFDAAAIVEVIEHLDVYRLKAFERVVFEFSQPRTVIITTPNSEYNVMWETLQHGTMHHSDHRFEWTRKEFQDWAERIAATYHYRVEFHPIGDVEETVGAPSQMALFTYGN